MKQFYLQSPLAIFLAAIALGLAVVGLAPSGYADQSADEAKVKQLVESLIHDKFAARNRAAKELERLIAARPMSLTLFLAQQDYQVDLETRRRVESMLQIADRGPKYAITDSVGNPIAGALTETYELPVVTPYFSLRDAKLLGRSISNENGTFRCPHGDGAGVQRSYVVRVYAPGLGMAGFSVPPIRNRPAVRLPLVNEQSEEARRAVSGRVIDQNGKPIADAAVRASFVHVPSGAGRNLEDDTFVLTDSEGRFRLYRALAKDDKTLLPNNAVFQASIRTGRGDYYPQTVHLNAAEEATIQLIQGTQYHTIQFDVDEEVLGKRSVNFFYRGANPPASKVLLPQRFLAGAKLVPGTYEVVVPGLEFELLHVTADSPERLTFYPKLPRQVTGRVVDGITHEPFANAILFLYDGSKSAQLVDLSDDDWDALAESDLESVSADPAFKKLSEVYSLRGISRSDDDGRFSVGPTPGRRVYGVIAISSGRLPVVRRIPTLEEVQREKGNSARINRDVGDLPLYQSARVQVQPVLEGRPDLKSVSFWPVWEFSGDNQPSWFAEFERLDRESRHGVRLFHQCKYLAKANSPHQFLIPANVDMMFHLDSAYTTEWSPLFSGRVVRARPGEVLDLGKPVALPTIKARVKVLDAEDAPVENCPVRYRHLADRSWQIGKMTDVDGEVEMRVGANLKGEFGVIGLRGPRAVNQAKNLRVGFQLTSEPQQPFVIRLNAEQVKAIPQGRRGLP